MTVTVKDLKTGKTKTMADRFGRILVAIGKHEYITTSIPESPRRAVLTPKTQADDLLGDDNADLDKMDLPALHALAITYGLTLHPQTGQKKVKAAIIAHRAESK